MIELVSYCVCHTGGSLKNGWS